MIVDWDRRGCRMRRMGAAFSILGVLLLAGCVFGPTETGRMPSRDQSEILELEVITPRHAEALLSGLGLGTVCVVPDQNAIAVTGPPAVQQKAAAILDLVDSEGRYVIEVLAPVSAARSVPTNQQIAEALGDVAIGTFAEPPQTEASQRAIIDIHGESIVAIIPVGFQRDLIAFVALGPEGLHQVRGQETIPGVTHRTDPQQVMPEPTVRALPEQSQLPVAPATAVGDASAEVISAQVLPDSSPPVLPGKAEPVASMPAQRKIAPPAESTRSEKPEAIPEEPVTAGVVALSHVSVPEAEAFRKVSSLPDEAAKTMAGYDPASLPNADDVLELDLPDRLEMLQLLDLVAEYMDLDYMYDPEQIRGQSVSLRLHGKSQGDIRVRELYPLLESVLKFKGFAMTRHQGNLVTIVPIAEALEVDPTLLDSNNATIETGDMVVTRVFDLQYVKASSAMDLLSSMKLSVAVSPIEETQTLIVTCYAHRMTRIERLLNMVDRPGRPKEFRFRQLRYTMASTLSRRVEAIVTELQNSPGRVASPNDKPSTPVLTIGTASRSPSRQQQKDQGGAEQADKCSVYLDADERTNRILMIGCSEQLAVVEQVIASLDVVQHDLRALKVYSIVHVDATDVVRKLQDLEILGKSDQTSGQPLPVFVARTPSPGRITSPEVVETAVIQDTQVTVLEPTNSLLINATEEQHSRIGAVIDHIDVIEKDLRILRVYDIQHVDAEDAKAKLSEFELIGEERQSNSLHASLRGNAASSEAPVDGSRAEEVAIRQKPQVVVLDSTNSLLINATEFQHARMASIIEHVDSEARQEAIPYEIYFLENQDPESLAEVLGKLVQKTVKNEDDKIERPAKRIDNEITIVPDKGTFSLIVYASRKNQEWISKLVEQLDRRRPQVLIDVTLVEITKTEAFTYDLNLLRGSPRLGSTSSVSGVDPNVIGRFVQATGGTFTAFYGDQHIQTLLQAMQSKNYGRVLAKPKILVNDNEAGMIKAADTTYVETKSGIPVNSAAAGSSQNFVETSFGYEPYEAGITLDITPHISDSDLLRLDIALARSDFLETEDKDRPPNLRSNEVTTTVTVPDGSTIILGGLLKLNQNKGGAKVPILGDVPIVGGLFRSINNQDRQDKLYVFVKAEIIRPANAIARGMQDLEAMSERDRMAFEAHEQEFQDQEDWPGLKPKSVKPAKVLDAR
jgi:general secretion pathway protein D